MSGWRTTWGKFPPARHYQILLRQKVIQFSWQCCSSAVGRWFPVSEYLNQLLKSEEILKENTYFLTGMPSKIKKGPPEKNRHPKSFSTFLIEEKIINFRVFFYELEIAETFEMPQLMPTFATKISASKSMFFF